MGRGCRCVARETAAGSYTVWARSDGRFCPSASDAALAGWAQVAAGLPSVTIRPSTDTSASARLRRPRGSVRAVGQGPRRTAARSARSTGPPARTAPSTTSRSSSTCGRSSRPRCRRRGRRRAADAARRLCRPRPWRPAATGWPRASTRTRRRATSSASTTSALRGGSASGRGVQPVRADRHGSGT